MASQLLESSTALWSLLKDWAWYTELLLILAYADSIGAMQREVNALPDKMRPLLNVINLMREAKAELLKNPALFREILTHVREVGGYSHARRMYAYFVGCLAAGREFAPNWFTPTMDESPKRIHIVQGVGLWKSTIDFRTEFEGSEMPLRLFVNQFVELGIATYVNDDRLSAPEVVRVINFSKNWPFHYHDYHCSGTAIVLPASEYGEELRNDLNMKNGGLTSSYGASERFLTRIVEVARAKGYEIGKITPVF